MGRGVAFGAYGAYNTRRRRFTTCVFTTTRICRLAARPTANGPAAFPFLRAAPRSHAASPLSDPPARNSSIADAGMRRLRPIVILRMMPLRHNRIIADRPILRIALASSTVYTACLPGITAT